MSFRPVTIVLTLAVAFAAVETARAQAPPATPKATPRGSKPAPPSTVQRGRGTPQRGTPQRGAPGLTPAAKARLRNPARLTEVAPATYSARFDTSVGPFVILVHRDWAPRGADRFYNLVKNGFFDGTRFFRVLPNFMVQFGINGDPSIQSAWRDANITDEPVKESNKRGYITFAKSGAPDSRTTQVFISFKNNAFLDGQGFAPFGEVISGMEVVDKINAEYKEMPDQGRLQAQGNAYLAKSFPRLDSITKATIVPKAAPTK